MSEPVQTLVAAVAETQAALAAYLEPGGPDHAETLDRLLSILDHEDVVRAVHAINPVSPGDLMGVWTTPPLPRDRRSRPAGFIAPCAPVLVEVAPAGPLWMHEVKHDGYRVIAVKRGRDVRLWSRNARDWSTYFIGITAAIQALPVHTLTIDGEVIAHDERGLPNFYALRLSERAESAVLYGFDLMVRAGQDIRAWRCDDRREALLEVLGGVQRRSAPVQSRHRGRGRDRVSIGMGTGPRIGLQQGPRLRCCLMRSARFGAQP